MLDARDEGFDCSSIKIDNSTRTLFAATAAEANDPRPEAMLKAVRDRGGKSLFLKLVQSLGTRPSRDAVLAAISTTIAWGPLMRKRISRLTAETLPWYLRLYGVMIGASIPAAHHQSGSLCGISREERFGHWSMADVLFLALTGKRPTEAQAKPLQILIGLLISNGPVRSPRKARRARLPPMDRKRRGVFRSTRRWSASSRIAATATAAMALRGWHSSWINSRMQTCRIPTDRHHGLDLKAVATRFAQSYKEEKSQSKEVGADGPRALPGVHHPIFKGKPVNYDPRERFIAEFMEKRGDYNVFHAFYRELVQALYDTGATRYVFCVNVHAVIAALLLAVLRKDCRTGKLRARRTWRRRRSTCSCMGG